MRITPILMALTITLPFFAQGPDTLWTKVYGGSGADVAYSVIETTDGFYLAAGYTGFGAGNQDAWLMKLDKEGDTLWAKPWGGTSPDGAHSVIETSDSGYLLVGYTESFGNGGKDLYLIKTDSDGNQEWAKIYGGPMQDVGYAACVGSGGYMICGYVDGPVAWTKGDLWILKIDESGDTLWTKRYGGASEDYGISIRRLIKGNNGYIISGATASFGAGGKDAWLVRITETGDTMWSHTFGNAAEDVGYGVNLAHNGGYVITGYVDGSGAWTAGNLWIINTDLEGAEVWTKTYTSSGENYGFEIYPTTDGGYVCAGLVARNSGDLWFVKTDSLGDTLWTANYGGTNRDNALSLCITSDGGYLAAGLTFTAGTPDFYLVKTRPMLELITPNGGEVLITGTTHNIEWQFENLPRSSYLLRLVYSHDGDNYIDTISSGIEATQTTYEWEVPYLNSPNCYLKVQLVDEEGFVIAEDESDGAFSMTGVEEKIYPAPSSIQVQALLNRLAYEITGEAQLTIYSADGCRVLTETLEGKGVWEACDAIPQGVYFARFQVGECKETARLVVVK